MSDASSHPRVLDLPRDEDQLATPKQALRRIEELLPVFLENLVEEADADGFVVALDGGVESTVAAPMAAAAVGPDAVTGLVMPAGLNDEASARDAEAAASALGIDCHRLHLQPLVTAFQRVIGTAGDPADDLVAMDNAAERFRMACTYYVANTTNALVVGSTNRTERLLGSVAKHGANGVDVALLGDLYRTEVRALAAYLGVPAAIRERSAPGRPGPTDAERLGVDPRTLDALLRLCVDEGVDVPAVADRLEIDRSVVRRAKRWCANTRHKRHEPPKPSMAV